MENAINNDKQIKQKTNSRILYLDYLRVLAILSVIVIHLSAQNLYVADVHTSEWQAINFYDSIARWCVPVFVMISGALFLGKEIRIKKLFTKYILRLITAFIFWSALYAIYIGGETIEVLMNFFTGRYHMWFIPMIIGLYISIPVINKIIESPDLIKYYFGVAFIYQFFVPFLFQLYPDIVGGSATWNLTATFLATFKRMDLYLMMGYAAYFILGYCLNKMELDKKSQYIIYLIGLIGFLSTIIISSIMASKRELAVPDYYDYFSLNVLMESIGIFVWFKYHSPNIHFLNSFISKLSLYSFGTFLVHDFLLEIFSRNYNLNSMTFHPIICIPFLAILIFIISTVISWLIHQIPILKKYIV